jgi:phage baseplate assembly protein W
MAQTFTSIRYPVAIDASLGRLAEEPNYSAHVEQLIMQLLLTSPGERINRPDLGCGVRRMVFSPNSRLTASLAQAAIFEALNKWLSSVIIVGDIRVQAVEEKLNIWIAYTLRVRQEKRYLNLEVTL